MDELDLYPCGHGSDCWGECMDTDDYTDADRWDWDQNDDSQYCQHGTFIGSWWGPDILCGWCEDGISREEMVGIQHQAAIRKWTKERGEIFMWLRMGRTIMQDPMIRSLPMDRQWSIREWSVRVTAQKLDEFEELLQRRPVGVRSTISAEGMGIVLCDDR